MQTRHTDSSARPLTGQVALVTGAARGIGHAIALELACQGASVVVNYQSSAQAAEQLAETIQQHGGQAFACQASVTDRDAVVAMLDTMKQRWGRLDILVNNAGITADGPFIRMRDEQWQRVIETNLTGVLICCQAALPLMRAQHYGRIVNIGSLAGLAGNLGQANYAAAKAGLVGLTRALAREVALDGITANVVAPGYIETDLLTNLPEHQRRWALEAIAMQRFGTAQEVAPAVAFLASPAAAYISGQVLCIDGGWVMP